MFGNIYQSYKHSRNLAWIVLIDNGISSLPVDLKGLIRKLNIRIGSYYKNKALIELLDLEQYCNNDGFSVVVEGQWYILYNSEIRPKGRLRFTIAHELGHVLLGHNLRNQGSVFGRIQITPKNIDEMDPQQIIEFEANIFASRLLAPACVLHELHILDAKRIADLCGLSHSAAVYRARRLQELERRDAYYISALENQVRKQFQDFITNYHYQ